MTIEILLLTQSECAFCKQARAILERLEDGYDLSVKTLDIGSQEGERVARAGGILFPPGIFVNGEAFSYGRLSERKLQKYLKQVATTAGSIG